MWFWLSRCTVRLELIAPASLSTSVVMLSGCQVRLRIGRSMKVIRVVFCLNL